MPSDGTLAQARAAIATLAAADSILVDAGLLHTYHYLPPDLSTGYVALFPYRDPRGNQFRQMTNQGLQAIGMPLVAGSRWRQYSLKIAVCVGHRVDRQPSTLATLEALAEPWVELIDDFFTRHITLGGVVQQALATDSAPGVINLNDGAHWAEIFDVQIISRPLTTFGG